MRQSERLRAKQLRKSLSELEEQKEINRENDYEVYEEDINLIHSPCLFEKGKMLRAQWIFRGNVKGAPLKLNENY